MRAARALAPLTSQPTEFSSNELSFIAHPSTVAAARWPYASEARIAAASLTSTSAVEREQLLREAIAISPGSVDADSARLDLLSLQPATADSSSTLAILRSLQNPPVSYQPTANIGERESGATANDPDAPARGSAIDSPDNVVVPAALLPPAAFRLDLAARIRLATQLSSANQSDGNLESAFAYAELTIKLAKDPQPELTRRRDDLKTAILLARRNSLRRPDLHAALEQSKQVRPRLTASAIYQEESQ